MTSTPAAPPAGVGGEGDGEERFGKTLVPRDGKNRIAAIASNPKDEEATRDIKDRTQMHRREDALGKPAPSYRFLATAGSFLPCGSSTCKIRSAGTSANVCRTPLGQ
jgi:hypothetical protein